MKFQKRKAAEQRGAYVRKIIMCAAAHGMELMEYIY